MILENSGNRLIVISALVLGTLSIPTSPSAGAVQASEQVTAIVGVTVIDGNGGPPVPDATILIRGNRMAEIGPRASVRVPQGARVIDGSGKYATPGFIDTKRPN